MPKVLNMVLKLSCLPQRYVFAIVGFLVTLVGYMMRVSLDVTISSMINQTITAAPPQYDPYSCPVLTVMPNQTDTIMIEQVEPMAECRSVWKLKEEGLCSAVYFFWLMMAFDWDNSTEKTISSAFKTAYIMTQFIGGMAADRKGGKMIMGFSLTILSISTFVIPFASKLMGSKALYVLRFLSGLASGTIIPVLLSMMSKWTPKDEHAFIGSIIFPGSLIGYAAGSLLGDLIVTTIGWEAVFYTFGLFGVICCFLWAKLVYSTPNEHPAISDIEKRYLNEHVLSLKRTTKYELDPLPWKGFLRCGTLWVTVMGYVGREWAFAIFTTQVPQMMKDILHLDITSSPLFLYTPYLLMCLAALFFGFICDIITKREICSVKNARKMFTSIGTIGAIVCIIMLMYSGCNHILAIFWMFTGMTALGAFYSGCMIGALDITPNYAGSMIGVIDNIAINSALLLPKINAMVITDALLQQWRLSLWIVIIVLIICIAVYFCYVQAEQVWWDDVRKNGYPENWTHGLLPCEGFIDENGKSIYKANGKDERINSEL